MEKILSMKGFMDVCDALEGMANKAEATEYINFEDFKQECDKTGVDMEKDYYGYEQALEFYCSLLNQRGKFPKNWIWDASGLSVHKVFNA